MQRTHFRAVTLPEQRVNDLFMDKVMFWMTLIAVLAVAGEWRCWARHSIAVSFQA